MRLRKFASYVGLAVVASLGVSGTAFAMPAETESSVETTDVALNKTLDQLKPYLVEKEPGKVSLEAPADVVASVDEASYEVISLGILIANESPSVLQQESAGSPEVGGDASSGDAPSTSVGESEDASVPPFPDSEFENSPFGAGGAIKAFIKFVKNAWSPIVKAAKRSGKWAWYKAGRCADGAVSALWSFYDGDAHALAMDIATQYQLPLGIAIAGCVRKL